MVNKTRIRNLTGVNYVGGTVIYQMCRELRAHDNEALLFAQELAKSKCGQLVVNYVIWNYTWKGSTRRFYDWVIPSLQEVEKELQKNNIPLVVTFENENMYTKTKWEKMPEHVGAVVCEILPLHFMDRWKQIFLQHHSEKPLFEVDAHNIVPVWVTSAKQEFAARTIRPKIHTRLTEYLETFGILHIHLHNQELIKSIPQVDWDKIKRKIVTDESISGTGEFIPGTKAGQKILTKFLSEKLSKYEVDRNDFSVDGQSDLSPYLSHGNIARRRVILTLLEKTDLSVAQALTDPTTQGFMEECIVRAELAENFCFYNKSYDSYEGFPNWAKETLSKAMKDTREHTYSLDEFRHAKTGDDLWNAAQIEMIKTGKMHGYLRMYWAKKILEWTKTPKEAMKIAVLLNDQYELDGRDPNGYVGCAWSIGGVHDRPWFGRPIFGTVRYMAESGAKKKDDMKEYINKWLGGKEALL